MKRYLYLFPLMAFTAATLTLSACDDKKNAEDEAQTDQTTMAPASDMAASGAASPATSATTPSTETMAQSGMAVQAEGANAYATASGATSGAVFLTLHNPGTQPDRLMSVKTDAATTAEIHESYVDDAGTMQMRKVDQIEIPAGQQVTLKPDGYHIMLTGLTKPLVEGETFNVTLTFQTAPEVTVPVTITAAGGAASSSSMAPSATDTMDHGTTGATSSESTSMPDSSSTASPTMDESPSANTGASPSPTTTDGTATTPSGTTGTSPATGQ